jgi:hypothetical protein
MTTTPSPEASPTPNTFAPPRTLSILSLVAAIASLPLGHIVILPIAAIVLGFLARTREPAGRTLANWGIVLGFVLLFWWVAVAAFAAAVWVPLALIHHLW